jgi:hypothetical protein
MRSVLANQAAVTFLFVGIFGFSSGVEHVPYNYFM